MYRNWFLVSLVAFLAVYGTLHILPQGPMGSTPIALDGGDSGDDGDNDNPGGPGL